MSRSGPGNRRSRRRRSANAARSFCPVISGSASPRPSICSLSARVADAGTDPKLNANLFWLNAGGKTGLLGFFVGQVMRDSKGKADPKLVNDLVRKALG